MHTYVYSYLFVFLCLFICVLSGLLFICLVRSVAALHNFWPGEESDTVHLPVSPYVGHEQAGNHDIQYPKSRRAAPPQLLVLAVGDRAPKPICE